MLRPFLPVSPTAPSAEPSWETPTLREPPFTLPDAASSNPPVAFKLRWGGVVLAALELELPSCWLGAFRLIEAPADPALLPVPARSTEPACCARPAVDSERAAVSLVAAVVAELVCFASCLPFWAAVLAVLAV